MQFRFPVAALVVLAAASVQGQGIGGAIGSGIAGATSVFDQATSGAASVGQTIATGATSVFGEATSGAASVATGVATTIVSGGSSIVSTVASGGSSIVSSASSAATSATSSAGRTDAAVGSVNVPSMFGPVVMLAAGLAGAGAVLL